MEGFNLLASTQETALKGQVLWALNRDFEPEALCGGGMKFKVISLTQDTHNLAQSVAPVRLGQQGSPGSGESKGKCTGFYKSQGSWPKEQLTFFDNPTVFLAIELASSLSG